MIKKVILTIIIILLTVTIYSQQNFCADSSFRFKYIFGNDGATLYNNPDTLGKNIFTGSFLIGNQTNAIAILKTTWGDSMVWAKKIYANGGINITSFNSVTAPDGSIVCAGAWGNPLSASEFLICKISANGNVQWIKRFKAGLNHVNYGTGLIKNLTISNNSIYFNVASNNLYKIIAKLDLNGNVLWSTGYNTTSTFGTNFFGAPMYYNNNIIILGYKRLSNSMAGSTTIITRLNDVDGSITEAFEYKTAPDTLVKSFFPLYLKYNTDNSFSLLGSIDIDLFGRITQSNIRFNTLIDGNFNVVHNYYYTNNIPLDNNYSFNYDFNNKKQHAILASNIFNSNDKYFVTFGKNDEVQRSRKFIIPAMLSNLNRLSVNLDDKENLHFLFHYPEATGKLVTEYARISNLAPTGTLGCFGKDTSILTRYPFTLTKEPFVWDNVQSNVIVSNDVAYTEDTAIVTKELVCKIVSRCDSVHINGPAAACVGVPVRYTVSKNSGCFKNLDWSIDTAFATIVNLEGDSAITLNFKKTFNGYIRAALTDCVVKDSFLVKAVVPKMLPLLKRTDSLLCPGKTLVLAANNGYTNYLWQGSVAAQQFTVNAIGVYTVTALDSCGLLKTDSIRVTLADTSLIVPATQTICLYDTAFITLPADVNNITWQPTTNSLLTNKTLLFYPPQTTLYTITAERTPNCSILKTITVVIKTCPQTVFIPNSFTPNNDSKNDIFKPAISQPLALYRLQIFNRYGQTIFESNNQQSGWDGAYKGKQQPMGGYIYQCSYKFNGGVQKMVKGYFILVR
ncbi:gliding motility-associated C-terminal domain-containing protein [Ferruginibacter sp.]|nr:gliding motility-associated C-terminal domain-containing protein [Ferruginibacter sp.]